MDLLLAVVCAHMTVTVVPRARWLLNNAAAVTGRARGWPRDVILGQGLLVMAVVLHRLVLA